MNTMDLVKALERQTPGALEELKLHYGPLLRYIIAPILPDERDREECLSDVLLRVWDRIGDFDPQRGSWTNWLSALARNAAIDRARRLPPVHGELADTLPAPDANPEQLWLRRERQQALRKALDQLGPPEQRLFLRKYYYRQSTAQIAAECGTTERAVEGRLYRIKKKLRKLLGGDFYDG